MKEVNSLALLLQGSIAPCILFSGIGFFLLMLGNTLPRPAELIRRFLKELQSATPENRPYLEGQIRLLFRRCLYLRWAIGLTTLSMLFIFIIISSLFFQQFYSMQTEGIIKVSFLLNKIVMIVALCCYLQDVRLKLNVLRGEINRDMQL